MKKHAEENRIKAHYQGKENWLKWGPYLSERQWGTVRETNNKEDNPWTAFPFEDAEKRVYQWGEDGIAGISDDQQYLCFAISLWNGKDPIIKERLYGLNNLEANHGEDCKELYYHLDNTPSHAYMRYLYKYPINKFPYQELKERNNKQTKNKEEYEVLDTGIFNKDEYFDILIEYAKEQPEDISVRITIYNRSENLAQLSLLPTLWFRNLWS